MVNGLTTLRSNLLCDITFQIALHMQRSALGFAHREKVTRQRLGKINLTSFPSTLKGASRDAIINQCKDTLTSANCGGHPFASGSSFGKSLCCDDCSSCWREHWCDRWKDLFDYGNLVFIEWSTIAVRDSAACTLALCNIARKGLCEDLEINCMHTDCNWVLHVDSIETPMQVPWEIDVIY
jgi:hypothetical protein